MSAITFAELQHGVAVAADPERARASLDDLVEDIPGMPFDAAAARFYGPIRLDSRKTKRDHLDKLIAAHAVALGVTVSPPDPTPSRSRPAPEG